MSTIGKAAVLSLAAVLLIPSAAKAQPQAEAEPVVLLVQRPQAQEVRTITVLQDGEAAQLALDTYLTQVVLSELPASFAPAAMQAGMSAPDSRLWRNPAMKLSPAPMVSTT